MPNHNEELNHILEIMIDDILDATDEEIINEAIEDGLDVEKEAHRAKSLFNKCRYNVAKKIVEEKERSEEKKSNTISIEDARKKIKEAINKNPKLRENLTMAARSGDDIPDDDIIGYYEDLFDLGIFDDDPGSDD